MGGKDRLPATSDPAAIVADLVAKARVAQRAFEATNQERVDEVVTAAGWAIVEPERSRALAELAVRDTGLGNVADKIAKNRRKTMGLLRDLREVGRSDRRNARARIGGDRPAGRCRRRAHSLDQPCRNTGEQHHQRAQRA
jgi:sulfoacetaldehyde dehydrogenase